MKQAIPNLRQIVADMRASLPGFPAAKQAEVDEFASRITAEVDEFASRITAELDDLEGTVAPVAPPVTKAPAAE